MPNYNLKEKNRIGIVAGHSFNPQAASQLVPGYPGKTALKLVTADAVAVDLELYAPLKSQQVTLKLRASAIKSDGSVGASWEIFAAVRCDSTGTLTLIGTSVEFADADGGFAPTLEVKVIGANIVAEVVGVAATTINWSIVPEVC